MKRILFATLAMVMILTVGLMAQEAKEEKPWFDMEKCTFCKEFSAQDGLMENTQLECHNISNGVLTLMTIPEEFREAMKKAHAGMKKVAENMGKTGEMPYMCGHCTAYGEFMMAGITPEAITTATGEISLMTSSDADMVAKLHAFGDRNKEEWLKMEKMATSDE